MNKSSSNKAITSGVWYIIGNFVTKAAGFITTPVFTRLLTKTEIGDYSNYISWIELLMVICTLDLYSSVMLAKYDYKEELDNYIATNLLVGTGFTMIMFFLSIMFQDTFMNLFNFTEWQLKLAFVYMSVYPASQMFLVKSRIFYKYKSYVFYSFASVVISTVSSLVASVISADKLLGRVCGQYIPLIVFNVIIYAVFMSRVKGIRFDYIKYSLAISVPLIWHTLAGNVLSISDRVMIRKMCGSEATALYSIGYYCALIVSVLWSSMNNAWSPWAYDKMAAENTRALRTASIPYMIFFGGIVICFLLVGPEILLLMGGKSYSSAIDILPPIMVSIVFQFVYSLYVNIEFFYKKQVYIAIGTTIAAVTNLILNFIFLPKFGYIAAAYTTLVGYIVLFGVHYLLVRSMGKDCFYNTKFNIAFLGMFLLLSVSLRVLYKSMYVRYALIIVLLLFFTSRAITHRYELKECIREKSLVGIANCLVGDLKSVL